MNVRSALLLTTLVFVLIMPLSTASPYIGGYLKGSAVTASKVLDAVNFAGTKPSEIPDDKWLGGVLSVAGGNGLSGVPVP